MAYNYIFILVTLASGYLCLKSLHFTKYRLTRYTGQELFFSSAVAGLIIFLVGFSMDNILQIRYGKEVAILTRLFDDVGIFYAAVGLLTALPLIFVANQLYSRDRSISKFIEEQNNGIERLLQTSQKYLKPLIITLNTGKVYIGIVIQFSPVENRSFSVMPLYSGYRDQSNQDLIITNEYVELINKYKNDDPEMMNDLMGAFPMDSIVSVSVFNDEIYQELNTQEGTTSTLHSK